MDVGRPAVDEGEAGRVVHPPVDRDDEQRSRHAGDRDGDAAQEVESGRNPVPSIRINPDKDGFDEEGEPFQGEAETEDVPEVLDPHRPEQAQFEAQDGPRHDPDREQREHDPRPAPC
jgi:hypothetical protein